MTTTAKPSLAVARESLKTRATQLNARVNAARAELQRLEVERDEAVEEACRAGCDFSALELLGSVLREAKRRGGRIGMLP